MFLQGLQGPCMLQSQKNKRNGEQLAILNKRHECLHSCRLSHISYSTPFEMEGPLAFNVKRHI